MPCASGSTLHCSSPIIFYFCQKLSYLFIYLSLTCLECQAQHKALQSGVRNYHYFCLGNPKFCFVVSCFLFSCERFSLCNSSGYPGTQRFTCLHLSPPPECWDYRPMSPPPDINFVLKREAGMEHIHGRKGTVPFQSFWSPTSTQLQLLLSVGARLQ